MSTCTVSPTSRLESTSTASGNAVVAADSTGHRVMSTQETKETRISSRDELERGEPKRSEGEEAKGEIVMMTSDRVMCDL